MKVRNSTRDSLLFLLHDGGEWMMKYFFWWCLTKSESLIVDLL